MSIQLIYCHPIKSLDHLALFKNCPNLIPHSNDVDTILESWREYKMMVPTYGAILLDSSYKQVSTFHPRDLFVYNLLSSVCSCKDFGLDPVGDSQRGKLTKGNRSIHVPLER